MTYLADYKGKIALYFTANLLSIFFGMLSLAMLAPVLQVLFMGDNAQTVKAAANSKVATDIMNQIKAFVHQVIASDGKLTALAYICVAVVVFTVFKNLFLYISLYILNPLRNVVLRRLRDDMFTKMLSLPIGFFTEERPDI